MLHGKVIFGARRAVSLSARRGWSGHHVPGLCRDLRGGRGHVPARPGVRRRLCEHVPGRYKDDTDEFRALCSPKLGCLAPGHTTTTLAEDEAAEIECVGLSCRGVRRSHPGGDGRPRARHWSIAQRDGGRGVSSRFARDELSEDDDAASARAVHRRGAGDRQDAHEAQKLERARRFKRLREGELSRKAAGARPLTQGVVVAEASESMLFV